MELKKTHETFVLLMMTCSSNRQELKTILDLQLS